MEVNVDMLEQMDLMDMSDQEALDVFLHSGGEDNSAASPVTGSCGTQGCSGECLAVWMGNEEGGLYRPLPHEGPLICEFHLSEAAAFGQRGGGIQSLDKVPLTNMQHYIWV